MLIRKCLLLSIGIFLFLSTASITFAGGFDDVPRDHWAYKAVEYLYSRGVLVGDEWGRFNGDEAMTRYEFAVAVARIMQTVDDIEANGGSYDVDGESKELGQDVYGIVDELEKEFTAEIESIKASLAEHEARLDTLEGDVQDIKSDVGDLSDKVAKGISNIKLTGDVRLRLEGKYNSDDSQVQRPRIRLRLSLDAPINDQVKFKGRLASGSSADPTSTNQTFENEFEKKPIWIDRAYLEWKPGNLPGWSFIAGKFGPNWTNTLITIDSDVNVEGIGQSYKNEEGFVVNLAEMVPDVKGFYIVGQVGMEDLLTDGLDAYVTYHYINDQAWQFIEMKLKDGDLKNRFKFDRVDMDNYSAIDIIGRYSTDAAGTPLTLTGNYVLNLADDAQEGLSGLRQAAYANLAIGKAKEIGDVDGWVEYGKLQANSVLSFLTDADRGSDNEFYGAGVNYKWMKNLDLGFTFIYADRLSKDESFRLFQLDFLSKF